MKKISALFLLVLSSSAFAQVATSGFSYSMPAVEIGFKWNTAKIANSVSDRQEVGFQLGASTVFNFATNFGLRSGLFYSERPFRSEFIAGNSTKGKITYFDVPAQLMFKIEEYAGIYIGPTLSIKLGDEISAGKLLDAKSLLIPITFGAQFKFAPNLGANIFFEIVPGDLAMDVSNSRAVGVNLLFTLD